MTDPWTRAEDDLIDQLNDGRIDEAEFRAEMRYLRDDYWAAAEEAAQAAYDREME